MHSFYHALSSVKKFGGIPSNYQFLHDWFDESKSHFADFRHRAARHHSEGIFTCERIFGTTIKNSDGREIPVRLIGEQHVQEDLQWIPTLADWLRCIQPEEWMMKVGMKSRDLEKDEMDKRRDNNTPMAWYEYEDRLKIYNFLYPQGEYLFGKRKRKLFEKQLKIEVTKCLQETQR